ncbi:MAG: hypothetical protein K2G07_05650 [Muribaculaceae bacterium]|nr:hypothetical protein [Muribaculaceae bacterium]
MAKKKSQAKNHGQQAPLSPERFMREKARKLPVGKCYITSHWKEAGKSNIIVTRLRPNGNMVAGVFLVDTFCLGVKDAFYFVNLEPDRLESYLIQFREGPGIEEISYNEAHNIIYGAVAYAQDAGIKPDKSFDIAQYILDEDTHDIPLIEYEFGRDGKPCLIVGQDRKEMPYMHILRANLGDNFDFEMPSGHEAFDEDVPGNVFLDNSHTVPEATTIKRLLSNLNA